MLTNNNFHLVFSFGGLLMNKVYKVVWNKARNCYVVASELAKSSSRGTKVVAAVLAVSVMSTLGGGH